MSEDELFAPSEMDSLTPQGAWMRSHKITVWAPDEETGKWHAKGPDGQETYGPNKAIALHKLASLMRIKFYQ